MAELELGPRQEAWLKDLETTGARQVTRMLNDGEGGFCCLGRACEVAMSLGLVLQIKASSRDGKRVSYGSCDTMMPSMVVDFMGFNTRGGGTRFGKNLWQMNDGGAAFAEIAAAVRANPSNFFKESR